ncbi:unnamed protein product [Clonostachys rhizophaga]|uniref:Uncharacterized protein n=1 Tax=Clonostachys rhizophaga TaxID=160324 RepID=A0A9N9V157_9HYPO|nr:unnamed protein product [Clonostachys rhizophaga]
MFSARCQERGAQEQEQAKYYAYCRTTRRQQPSVHYYKFTAQLSSVGAEIGTARGQPPSSPVERMANIRSRQEFGSFYSAAGAYSYDIVKSPVRDKV